MRSVCILALAMLATACSGPAHEVRPEPGPLSEPPCAPRTVVLPVEGVDRLGALVLDTCPWPDGRATLTARAPGCEGAECAAAPVGLGRAGALEEVRCCADLRGEGAELSELSAVERVRIEPGTALPLLVVRVRRPLPNGGQGTEAVLVVLDGAEPRVIGALDDGAWWPGGGLSSLSMTLVPRAEGAPGDLLDVVHRVSATSGEDVPGAPSDERHRLGEDGRLHRVEP